MRHGAHTKPYPVAEVAVSTIRVAAWVLAAGALVWLWPAQFGGATTVLVVQGDSMQPTLHDGDLVVARTKASYTVGDVIVFTLEIGNDGPTARVMHRIIDITDEGTYATQGDNRTNADGYQTRPENVLGEVRAQLPQGGNLLWHLSRWWTIAILTGALVTARLLRADQPRYAHLPS